MEYQPHNWMREECSMVSTGETTRFYVDQQQVSEEAYRAAMSAQRERDRAARREQEFISAEDAFAYADTLQDGVVLDWGRCYAAMERAGLEIGFVITPDAQPIIERADLYVEPGTGFILARRGVREDWIGGCSTNFSDPSQSYSDDEVQVLSDGTGCYPKGMRLADQQNERKRG